MQLVRRFDVLDVVKLVELLLSLDILQVVKQILCRADKRSMPAQLGSKDGQTALRKRDLTLEALLHCRTPLRARLGHRAADDHHIGIEQVRDARDGLA